MRLARYLAHAGAASRRAAERLIAEGRVTVGGQVVTDPARDVDESSGVTLDGRPLAPEPREVYALNKPRGVVSTARDTHGRRTVTELVPSERRLYPVGRLDADTTGLILLTNDGELANRLTHPRYEVEKVYRVSVDPPSVSEAICADCARGWSWTTAGRRRRRVRQVEPGLLEVALREGRKRQVRRMCEAVGHRVLPLERTAFGPLRLGAAPRRRLSPAHARRGGAVAERLRRLAQRRGARPARCGDRARRPRRRPVVGRRSRPSSSSRRTFATASMRSIARRASSSRCRPSRRPAPSSRRSRASAATRAGRSASWQREIERDCLLVRRRRPASRGHCCRSRRLSLGACVAPHFVSTQAFHRLREAPT